MIDKALHLQHLTLHAANLVSSSKWSSLFHARGFNLKTLKLSWMDAAFEDQQIADMVKFCPNLTRVKLQYVWRLGEESLEHLAQLERLEHLSLQLMTPPSNESVMELIRLVGPKLKTLSLRSFQNTDDEVLKCIHDTCVKLEKLRISELDTATDAGFAALFTGWKNPPLSFIDVNAVRDVDNQNPDRLESGAVGIAGEAFEAMMAHSGSTLRKLNIASCRHIPLATLLDVFGRDRRYAKLEDVDLSFVSEVDDVVLLGLFRSASSSLKKVALFGCFAAKDVTVPKDVVVVGAPRVQQDGIELFGGNMNLDEEMPNSIREALAEELGIPADEMELD
jgi:DNA repair protein RAD7